MRKLLTILFLLASAAGFAQTEQWHLKTLDTLMTVRNSLDNSVIGSIHWLVRIRMDSTYYADIARDSNLRRPVLLSTGGKGEVATGNYASDTALLNRYGWEYAHNNAGYDFSVPLDNGLHHPIMVTVLVPATMRPEYWLDLFRQLNTLLKPRNGVFHVAGLSEGSHDLVGQIIFANGITGNTESMSYIKSFVNLEGVNPESFHTATDWTVSAGLQYWATHFGGRSMNFDGSALSVGDSWTAIVSPMNAAVPGSAYWALQNYGGGGHCCWNSIYDPTVTNFRCVSPVTNANIVSNSHNTMGNYTVDPVTGTGIFQWMLRQGDTTMVGSSTPPTTYTTKAADTVIAPGEYTTAQLRIGKGYAISGNRNLTGSNAGGIAYGLIPVQFPSNMKFNMVTEILHGTGALDTTGTVWTYGGNAGWVQGNGASTTTDVLIPNAITTDSAGNALTTVSYIKGTYAANQAEGLYFVKHGTLSDTLFMSGNTHFGMRGDGYLGDTAKRPVKVWPLPLGKRIVKIASEKYSAALLSDGTVWTTGGSFSEGNPPNTYAFLGYVPTDSLHDYLTWHQVSLPKAAVDIMGGDVGGTIVKLVDTSLYGWGPNSDYMGNPAGGQFHNPTNLATYVTNYIPGGVKYMAASSFGFHYISYAGKHYAHGDNAMGVIGNGDQINLATLTQPYFVDPAGQHQYMVFHPIQVTNRSDYTGVYASTLFGMGAWLKTASGLLIAKGRDKGGVLGAGIKEANSNVTQFMPDSYDRKSPTPVRTDTVTAGVVTYPPYCVLDSTYTYCAGITRPATTPHAVAGTNQTGVGAATTLNGSGSTCAGGSLITYHWYQVSGPNNSLIDVTDRVSPEISGMIAGTYTFRLVVTDNAQRKDSSTMTVTSGSLLPPTVVPGGPYTITLPANSQLISVTATGNSGSSITGYTWSKTSGSGSTTILNNTTRTPTVSGLLAGTYIFHCVVNDSNGLSTGADVTVYVLPASSTNTNYLSFPKRVNIR